MFERIEKFIERADRKADVLIAQSEYEEVLISSLRQQGNSDYDSIKTVRDIKKQDRLEFQNKATDYINYGKRITQAPEGIPIEMFNHVVNVNPTVVLANALEWALIEKQINSNDSTLVLTPSI